METRLPDTARCLWCGYSLRGLTENICPECGQPFLPEDPSTWKGDRTPQWRRKAKPPGVLHATAVVLLSILLLDARSRPIGALGGLPDPPILFGALFFIPAVVAVYAVRLVYTVMAIRNPIADPSPETAKQTRSLKWRWCVLPTCAALFFSTLVLNWPLMARFALSRCALEAEANKLLATHGAGPSPGVYVRYDRVVGYYWIDSAIIGPETDSVFFFTETRFSDSVGFVYQRNSDHYDTVLGEGWSVSEL